MAAVPPQFADGTEAAPQNYRVILDNERVRVVRVHYGPRERSVMHAHPSHVVVLLTDVHVRLTHPDGTTEEVRRKAGDVVWMEGPMAHAPENLGDSPAEAISIELK